MKRTKRILTLLLMVLLIVPAAYAQEGEDGEEVELLGEEFRNGSRFSSVKYGERPDTVGDVSGELRLSMYGVELEPNPAGSGNQATEIKIYFKFDGALAGRAGYQLCAWVVGEDVRGESSDFSCDWANRLAELLAADSDVTGEGLFPITIIDGEETLEFGSEPEEKSNFVAWAAQQLHEAMLADEILENWSKSHDTSILTQYKSGFRLVREGEVFIVTEDGPGPDVPDTEYSLLSRKLYCTPGNSTARTVSYCHDTRANNLDNPNFNFGSCRKRNDRGSFDTYYVVGLLNPRIEDGELVFWLKIIKWPMEGLRMTHEIRGQEAIDALLRLKILKIEDGEYKAGKYNTVVYTAKTGHCTWRNHDSYFMISRSEMPQLNEIYTPASE